MKENKFLKYFLLIWGGAQAAFLMWLFYYHYIFMDHVEHLHAAWLIWKGEVPYRDFSLNICTRRGLSGKGKCLTAIFLNITIRCSGI